MEKELFNLVQKKIVKRTLALFLKPPDFPSSGRGLAGLQTVVLDSSE